MSETPLLHVAQPVFHVNGEERAEVARDLLRLEVEETTEGLKTLVLHLAGTPADPDLPGVPETWLDGSVVDFGREVEVTLGPEGSARTVFAGRFSAVEAGWAEATEPMVTLFAEDALMELRATRRSRTYEDATDEEVAEAIADEHGLEADVDAPGPRYDRVQQWNRTDLAFLRDRAALIRAEVWVADGTLHFRGRGARTGTEIALAQGGDLIEARLRADLAHQRTAVRVAGWDAAARERIDEEARGDAVEAEASGGRTGPAVLERAFGERVARRVRDVPLDPAEAADRARAEMLRRARGFVSAAGTTAGTPEMVVGSRLSLERVGRPFGGPGWYVTRVRHTWDRESGHRTRFEAERATIND